MHFRVLVFGENPAKQIRPYRFNPATMLQDEDDETAFMDIDASPQYDYAIVGGSYSGLLLAKEGQAGYLLPMTATANRKPFHYDQLQKGQIDVDGMYAENAVIVSEFYDKLIEIVNGRELPPSYKELYGKYRATMDPFASHDAARKELDSYEVIHDLEKAGLRPTTNFLNALRNHDREAFMKEGLFNRIVPYAFVWDGTWVGYDDMSWTGEARNMTREEYENVFWNTFNSVSEDTLVTVYDCHI